MADLKSEEADLRPEGADLRAGGTEELQKSQMVSGTCCPNVSICGCVMLRGAAALKEPMTYA